MKRKRYKHYSVPKEVLYALEDKGMHALDLPQSWNRAKANRWNRRHAGHEISQQLKELR